MSLSINISDKQAGIPNIRSQKSEDLGIRKKTPKKKKIVLIIVALVSLVVVSLTLTKIIDFTSQIGLKISANDLIKPIVKDPELKKDSTGNRTNILIVGIDTRETDAGLQNTDTMIVASYSYTDHSVTMFSIPRDTYSLMPGTDDWYVKTNSIYNRGEITKKGTGLDTLRISIEDYVGLDIQYYMMVDTQGFKNIINILGGIEVYVENSFTDYSYPNELDPFNPYQVVSFEQGLQTMDGETAIKYARSRKSLDNYEGSDFARARRQQKVIEAIKDKLLSSETFLNPKKILDIMSELQNHIKVSEFTNEDIQAALSLAQKDQDLVTYSFVLDPNIGSKRVIKEGIIPDSYSIGPVLGLGEYEDIHDLVQRILKNPAFYEDDPLIYTYDIGAGYYETLELTQKLTDQLPFTTIVYRGTLFSDKQGQFIYDNSIDSTFSSSVKFLEKLMDSPKNKTPDFISNRMNGEDIVMMYGAEGVETEEVLETGTAQ